MFVCFFHEPFVCCCSSLFIIVFLRVFHGQAWSICIIILILFFFFLLGLVFLFHITFSRFWFQVFLFLLLGLFKGLGGNEFLTPSGRALEQGKIFCYSLLFFFFLLFSGTKVLFCNLLSLFLVFIQLNHYLPFCSKNNLMVTKTCYFISTIYILVYLQDWAFYIPFLFVFGYKLILLNCFQRRGGLLIVAIGATSQKFNSLDLLSINHPLSQITDQKTIISSISIDFILLRGALI